MRSERLRETGVTLVELLVVISIIAFLAGTLVVAAQKIRYQAQVHGTKALVEKVCNANERFYNDWRFYAPDSPIQEFAGTTWVYRASPGIPDEIEDTDVDTEAPGMPGAKMPTTGIEYAMISLALKGQYLTVDQSNLAGPRRTIANIEIRKGQSPTSRCIIVDTWGHPLFYDCHKPEGVEYARGIVKRNQNAFDVFSLGPDGRTSSTSNDIDDDGDGAVDESDEAQKIGESVDDINNWRGTRRQ